MWTETYLLLWSCLVASSSGNVVDSCPAGWTALVTGCYQFVQATSFPEASANCDNEGGFLVEIDSQEEQDALAQFHEDSQLRTYVFLGGTDENREGQWIGKHSGKEIMNFDGWYGSNPDNGMYGHCVYTYYYHKFKWNDVSCSWKRSGVALCEYRNETEIMEAPSSLIWEEGNTVIYINYDNDKSYKCDVSFIFNISNIDLNIQFKDIISVCSESDSREGIIQSLGKHSFELTTQSGIWMECSLGAAMVNGNLSQIILEDSLQCITSNSSCSVGWTNLGIGCYRLVKAGSHQEATSNCETEGGYLVEIDNQEEQDALSQFLQDSKLKSSVWLGGTDEEREGRWMGNYSGREIMRFNSWYYVLPTGGLDENCVFTYVGLAFKWDDSRCSYKSNVAALCEYPDPDELPTTTITPPHLGCSVGEEYKGNCYVLVETPKTWLDAQVYCNERNGNLTSIDNLGANNFLANLAGGSTAWIGASDAETEGSWKWTNGDDVLFTNWYAGQPDNGAGKQHCGVINYGDTGKWDDDGCGEKLHPFICQVTEDSSLDGWTWLATGYYRFVNARTVQEAITNCGNEGGYLVEIESQEEQDELSQFLEESKLRSYIWLGGTDVEREGKWVGNYSGREIMKFNAWYSGHPTGGLDENCLHTSFGYKFKWEDIRCSYTRNGVGLCEYPDQNGTAITVLPIPRPDPCLNGWTNLSTGCYRLVKAGSYQEATTNCNNEGGYLVEIDTQEEQDELARFYEDSKLRSYVWLGGTDENREGQWIGNYSGREIIKFNAWYYGSPTGGFGRNCLITYHSWSFKWIDYPCSYTRSGTVALCEYPDKNAPIVNSTTPVIDSCVSRWSSLTTGCYRLVKAGSYQEAITNCQNEGGYLVEIETQEEQDALAPFLQDSKLKPFLILLGGTDEEREGRWVGSYSRKEIMKFNGWHTGYPGRGVYGNCVYTYFYFQFKFYDLDCSWKGNAAALCEYPDQNKTITTLDPGTAFIWEQEITTVFISHNGKNYKCDLTFEFSVNNVSLIVQFRNTDSNCADYEQEEEYIESLGKHSFVFTSPSGFRMDCSVNVAMANEALSQPVIEDSLHCIATNNCLIGWTSLATGCYQLVKAGSHQEAMTNCENEGGFLVEIDSQQEQDALVQFLEESKLRSYIWLGGSDQEIEGQWIGNYSGQEIMKFNAWRYGYPGGGFDENCVRTYSGIQFKWDDCRCSYIGNNAALCEYPNQNDSFASSSTTTVDISEDCDFGWSSLTTGCYKFVKVGSYQEAQTNCSNEGGYLVEIETQEEQDALTQFHQDSQLRSTVWLGGTDEEREGQWVGSHSGEVMSFTSWSSGQPAGGFNENCIATDPHYKFKWNDLSCSWKGSAAALCEMPRKTQYSTTTSGAGKETTMTVSTPTPSKCPVCTTALLTTSECPACPSSTPTSCPTPEICPTSTICPSPTICPICTDSTPSTCPTKVPPMTGSCPVCPDPVIPTLIPDTCFDTGCKNAFNGLGMCVDISNVNWETVSKIIDFSAGTKDGECSKDCNCKCFKHTGCYSQECDENFGICLIPEQEEKRGFFIPAEYKKAFACDKSLDCFCYIKNYEGVTQPSDVVTKPRSNSSCKANKKCAKKKGKCFGKGDTVPKDAKRKGWCNKKAGCKCYKV